MKLPTESHPLLCWIVSNRTTLDRESFLDGLLPRWLEMNRSDRGGYVLGRGGQWKIDAWAGAAGQLPIASIGEAMDRGQPIVDEEGWLIAPVNESSGSPSEQKPPPATSSALLAKLPPERLDASTASSVAAATRQPVGWIRDALAAIDQSGRDSQRIEQLTHVLEASAAWRQCEDDDALLHAIADTACGLLGCQRASIFLWNKRRGKLIGRPALGIDGGRLEVDDDAGIVGEVLASEEPRWWVAGSDAEDRINRSVDHAQDFTTDSLVAVPMRGKRDQLIGVFEAINHHDGMFGPGDANLLADLSLHAAVAIESLRTQTSLARSRDRLVDDAANAVKLIGQHPSVEAVRKSAQKVAATDLTVLVLGKNGTGKEVLARHIHYESDRRNGPFIAVNCAALVESLLESELFGHEKGAFTDASETRQGKFESAHGGTLFLDEVGDMSPGGQAKLLRVLEDKVVVRVGGSQSIPVDVRVIAATNQPLEDLIAQKRFREDLFFRLSVVSLTLPSLAERGEDVLLLAEHFLSQFRYATGRPDLHLSDAAAKALLSHPWPGNVRELRNTMERVCYLASETEISRDDLMLRSSGQEAATADHLPTEDELSEATREFQMLHIQRAIESVGGNMTVAAEKLGLHRSNLYRKMRQLGMSTSAE